MTEGGQRRGRALAMTPPELDEYLTAARSRRVATVAADGRPHVVPLWFVWDGAALWLNSLVRSQRWTDLVCDSRVAVVVDGGTEFAALRGVEISGRAEPVGQVPRAVGEDPEVAAPERAFARKYTTGETFVSDGRHGWLRVVPERVVSWDFRKISAARSRGRDYTPQIGDAGQRDPQPGP